MKNSKANSNAKAIGILLKISQGIYTILLISSLFANFVVEQLIGQETDQNDTKKWAVILKICLIVATMSSIHNSAIIDSKIPFTPKGGRFCEENFLRYLDLCYVNPAYYKLKTFSLL